MPRAPYKYLDYYTFEDADLFFGREEETQKMVGEILSTKLLVLFSPSGSGKTSLINAGVRPALEKLGYRTVYTRFNGPDPISSVRNAVVSALNLPATDPNNDLHSFLVRAVTSDQSSVSSDQLSVTSNQHPATSIQDQATSNQQPLVLFLDQFEEFFLVFDKQPEGRKAFIEQVAKIKYDDQLPVFLVFSLREDYFANLHEFREAIPSIFQNNANLRLEPFTEEEAARAIAEPVKQFGYEYDQSLVQTLVVDLKNGKAGIEPIALQIVCHTLWQNRPGVAAPNGSAPSLATPPKIDETIYKKCHGVQAIMNEHTDRLLRQIPQRQQGFMARIFEALKTRDNTKLYRRLQDLQETLRLRDENRLKAALQKLAEIGVLRHEQRSGDDWYEFKHDYLVPEVTKWIQARREAINRRRFWYGVAPGAALLCGLLVYLFVQYNSFYAGTVTPENVSFQEEEIAIFRENPFHEVVVTTGYRLYETRDDSTRRGLKNHFNLGFQKADDWTWLGSKLPKVDGALVVYKLGKHQLAFDALVASLKDQNEYDRSQAADALSNLGQGDDRAIAALLIALTDQDSSVRYQATTALGNIDHSNDRVIAALVAALKDKNSDVRRQTASALRNHGQRDDRAIAALFIALYDQDYDVRNEAADALVFLGNRDDRLILALLSALKNKNEYVRSHAVNALENLGYSDERVIAALLTALTDIDEHVRGQAASALGELGHSDERVIAALLTTFKDRGELVRGQAAGALGNLGHNDERVISALFASLADRNKFVRRNAIATLVKFGHSNDRVISALLAALRDEDEYVRRQAVNVLGNLRHSDDRVITALLAAHRDPIEVVGRQAAAALGNLGKSDDRVITALRAVIEHPNENYYWRGNHNQAAAALVNLGQSDDRLITALLASLKDQDEYVREQAAAALGNFRHRDDRIIAALFDALKDWSRRSQPAAALVNLGQSDDRVITALLTDLKAPDENARRQAAATLGKLAQSDDRVISAFLASLKDYNWDVRLQAAIALGNLFKQLPEADLLKLLSNNFSGYRTAGAQALARQDSLSPALLRRIDQLRKNDKPWVRLAAWDVYELIQARLKSETEAQKLLHQADSVFATGKWRIASRKYESAFDILKSIVRLDSVKTARAKFQQARCAAKLKRLVPALDDLEIAFEYNPALRDTLRAEMSQPKNDWKILEGNWYLREVLLKKKD